MANESKIPNLDCMTRDDLWAFWKKYRRPSMHDAVELIGPYDYDANRMLSYKRIAEILANYACNKAVEMKCRLDGNMTAAAVYEHACQLCYEQLPKSLRW